MERAAFVSLDPHSPKSLFATPFGHLIASFKLKKQPDILSNDVSLSEHSCTTVIYFHKCKHIQL